MTFGVRLRDLRKAKGFTLRELGEAVGVGFTYLSRVENGRLNYGDYPSEALIHRLSQTLEADEDELLILAEKIPPNIHKRVLQRPEVFRRFAELDDHTLDQLLAHVEGLHGSSDS